VKKRGKEKEREANEREREKGSKAYSAVDA
jgi:hypothetical protein